MNKDTGFVVDGIVARRDMQPYLQFFVKGEQVAQVDMAQARNIALDILRMCSRTEADAMIHKFFAKQEYPEGAAAALMMEFRKFRVELDGALVDSYDVNTGAGKTTTGGGEE